MQNKQRKVERRTYNLEPLTLNPQPKMDDQRYTLNLAQLQRMLEECQRELSQARSDLENLRKLMLGIGQAFVGEALVEAASNDPLKFKNMSPAELANLIIVNGTRKMQRLTAFAEGLDPETRARVLQRLITNDPNAGSDDPVVARLKSELEATRALQRELEARARALEAETQELERQLAESLRQCAVLQTNYADLQRQMDALIAAQAEMPAVSETETEVPRASLPHVNDAVLVSIPTAWRTAVQHLLELLATHGWCERARLAHTLATDYHIGNGDAQHPHVHQAFTQARAAGWIEIITPRDESGQGSTPQLIRLTPTGRDIATRLFGFEPAVSELKRLLQAHHSPEHIALILAARDAFGEQYPEPVVLVNIFPDPIALEDGKRYEPDIEVQLADGRRLYVECERATFKQRIQRKDKWSKYFRVSAGQWYVVTPNADALNAIYSEITAWHLQHGGRVHLRMTHVQWLHTHPDKFWVLERELGRESQ